MARSESVAALMYPHFTWREDAMDQAGEQAYPKHVYANPLDPAIRPILAMGVLLLTSPYRSSDGKPQVFLGNDSEKRFSRWLQTVLKGLTVEEVQKLELRFPIEYLGTHSPRKGAPSYCAASPGGPSPISIFLRAGWSIGTIQKRNIFAGQGADQFVGRTATGLPIGEIEFATLPPNFINISVLTTTMLDNLVPGYVNYPVGFQSCIHYFFLLYSTISS